VHKRIISAVKWVEFVSDTMSSIILRGRWCHVIVLNVHAPSEDRIGDVKAASARSRNVCSINSLNTIKILFVDVNAKVGRENKSIFKQTIGNESLHEINDDNGVRVVNFTPFKNLTVKSMMLQHSKIRKYI
jgi:hypothetical protein